ncbi:MAG: hypothetical protein K0S23_1273 [Fluviicola sp.]|jgi:hypothetical protein|uniref:hypothetical protein n=1 Tax=Fluviicola sp. TaxID=1917219 RepID=UPI002619C988|nr:hypothetical protein [Fluviicola sp.]MDF3026966.1 hypothetical protein [Fluviicola sp.]
METEEFKDRPDKGEGSDHDSMKTLSSTTIKLSREGYSTQFKALKNGLESLETHEVFEPAQVKIINFYRFEGESDPSDNAILYVIETSTGEKGTLTDAYGVYTDQKVSEFVQQVEEIQKANTNPPADVPPEDQEVS